MTKKTEVARLAQAFLDDLPEVLDSLKAEVVAAEAVGLPTDRLREQFHFLELMRGVAETDVEAAAIEEGE